eukprot:RCo033779
MATVRYSHDPYGNGEKILHLPYVAMEIAVEVGSATDAGGEVQPERTCTCENSEYWRRLRVKKGISHMMCYKCGQRWKSRCPRDVVPDFPNRRAMRDLRAMGTSNSRSD